MRNPWLLALLVLPFGLVMISVEVRRGRPHAPTEGAAQWKIEEARRVSVQAALPASADRASHRVVLPVPLPQVAPIVAEVTGPETPEPAEAHLETLAPDEAHRVALLLELEECAKLTQDQATAIAQALWRMDQEGQAVMSVLSQDESPTGTDSRFDDILHGADLAIRSMLTQEQLDGYEAWRLRNGIATATELAAVGDVSFDAPPSQGR